GIVREASSLMLQPEQIEIKQKGGYENIVTSADIAVQDFLQARLSELLPGSGFICEEGDIADASHEYVWIIDPIDGTANYARGVDQCAICVGLYSKGAMLMSVVFLPRTGEMFHAEQGKGAWLNGRRIHVSDRSFDNAIMCTALPVYYKDQAAWCALAIHDVFMQCNDIRRLGAAAPELCYIAMGRFEMYFEYRLGAWDFAAASLILSEAGGYLSDLYGNPLDPTKASGVLAANNMDNLAHLSEVIRQYRI
ncbi:MAG: inositol monophosphatase, partial [Muribaculaceae bacterium]|nr:inositol monophosphatase [Muribaculaceae bacterium]